MFLLSAPCCFSLGAQAVAAQDAVAQDDPDCVEPSLNYKKWTNGFVTNSSHYDLWVSMCRSYRGLIAPGGESPRDRWDVEGVWSLDRSGNGKHVYKLGWGNWHVYDSSDLLPGYAYLSGTAWCRTCGWLPKARRSWNSDVAPDYVLLVDRVLHCQASEGDCVWAENDVAPIVALYDLPGYKLPVADVGTVSRFEIAHPRQPESIRMQEGYHAILYRDATEGSPWVCVENFAPDLNALKYPDGRKVGGNVGIVEVGQGTCPPIP
jgi:hypothetical protein